MSTNLNSVRSRTHKDLDNSPNARRTMEALREMGYGSYTSILDLIDNAVDATGPQGRIVIRHRRRRRRGHRLRRR